MDAPSTTRRAALKALTGAAAYGAGVTTISVGAIVATATNTAKAATAQAVSPEMVRLIAADDRADKIWSAYCEGPWKAAEARYTALAERIPPLAYYTEVESVLGNEIVWKEDMTSIGSAQRILADPTRRPDLLPHAQPFLDLVAERKAEREKANVESGMQEAFETESVLSREYCDAQDAVMAFPCASLADLMAKVAFVEMRGLNEDNAESSLKLLMADIRRLAKQEG